MNKCSTMIKVIHDKKILQINYEYLYNGKVIYNKQVHISQ